MYILHEKMRNHDTGYVMEYNETRILGKNLTLEEAKERTGYFINRGIPVGDIMLTKEIMLDVNIEVNTREVQHDREAERD